MHCRTACYGDHEASLQKFYDEAIQRLDRSEKNKCWIDEEFAAELGLKCLFPFLNYEEHGFASYFLASWLCTPLRSLMDHIWSFEKETDSMASHFTLISGKEAAAKIGKSIRQHRIARNITQREMAERTSVSPSTIKRIEAGGLGSLRDVMTIAVELNIEHDILNAIPRAPLRSLDDLDADGHRIQRVRTRAHRSPN